jgi:hypothetical protein
MSDSVNPVDVEIDLDNIPLEAEPGSYTATCKKCKVLKTKERGFPMLVLEWELTGAAEGSKGPAPDDGASVTDFVVIFPAGDKNHARSLKGLKALADACGVAKGEAPKSFSDETKDAWEELFTGREAVLRISHQVDKGKNEKRVRVNY